MMLMTFKANNVPRSFLSTIIILDLNLLMLIDLVPNLEY